MWRQSGLTYPARAVLYCGGSICSRVDDRSLSCTDSHLSFLQEPLHPLVAVAPPVVRELRVEKAAHYSAPAHAHRAAVKSHNGEKGSPQRFRSFIS